MNNEKILAHVRMFVLREKLLCPGEPLHLAAAVSGGADSMALLRILLALQPEFGFVLSACHVNHGLRGESADRDEAFVRAECARLGVPLRVFHAAEMADEVGLPSEHAGEDWARRLRYACFARLCGEGIDVVATAHTANDQAETLLLRLARGTGLHGAAGIRPKRGCYLRPLLALTRQDTESFCRAAGQAWVTDETNATDAYARNRTALTDALAEYGYTYVEPDGAFYLWVKALEPDANAFCERAKKYELLAVPSDSFGMPGWFRLGYCVSYETIVNSLPAWKQLADEYR